MKMFALARKIIQKLKLPLVELDYYFWLPNWVEGDFEKFKQHVTRLCQEEKWVMDGTYVRTLHERCEVADTIIFLDFPRWYCFWGIFKRYFISFFKPSGYKLDYAPTVNLGFLKHVWSYPRVFRPYIIRLLERLTDELEETKIIVFKRRKDIAQFLNDLK